MISPFLHIVSNILLILGKREDLSLNIGGLYAYMLLDHPRDNKVSRGSAFDAVDLEFCMKHDEPYLVLSTK